MAITTRTELLTAIDNWLSRTDLSGRAAEFVALCEADMKRRLRTLDMETITTVSATSTGPAVKPTGLIEIRRAVISQTEPVKLEPVSVTQAFEMGLSREAGQPEFYCLEGQTIRFIPTPDATYTVSLLTVSAFSPLSTSVTSNFILEDHPDAYLFGSLKEAFSYLRDDDELTKSEARYERAIGLIESFDKRKRQSGPLQSRAQVVV